MNKRMLLLVVISAAVGSCAPAVPFSQMPGMSNYRATADAAMNQAYWQEAAQTATAQAPIVRITETAAALAMQQQLWTATAQSVQETQVAAFTATANSINTTATVAQLSAQTTAISNDAMRDTLELQRQQNNNAFQAQMGQTAPLVGLVLLVGGVLLGYTWIARKQQYQVAEVDERGNVKPILNIRNGTYTDPDRNPNYRGAISDDVLKEFLLWMLQQRFGFTPSTLPQITTARQDAATERDQMIDLATRGLPTTSAEVKQRKQLSGQEMMKQIITSHLDSRFKVLENPSTEDAIDVTIIEALDHDWKESNAK